jgi:hypothetical protein
MDKSDRMRKIVAQGWTIMFILFLGNIVMDMVRIAVNGGATQWAEHLGMPGVKFVLVVMAIYAVMPVLVTTISVRWFRFVVVGVTALMTLFVGAHEVSHLVASDKPFGMLHALDLTHHLVGISVIVAAVLWARQPEKTFN